MIDVTLKKSHYYHFRTFAAVHSNFVFEKKYFFIILQYNHDFFFGNSSAKFTFKILAQNNSPADIVSARYFPFMKFHVHGLKSLKVVGAAPAIFKPIFKAIGSQEDVRRHDVRGGSSVPISGA